MFMRPPQKLVRIGGHGEEKREAAQDWDWMWFSATFAIVVPLSFSYFTEMEHRLRLRYKHNRADSLKVTRIARKYSEKEGEWENETFTQRLRSPWDDTQREEKCYMKKLSKKENCLLLISKRIKLRIKVKLQKLFQIDHSCVAIAGRRSFFGADERFHYLSSLLFLVPSAHTHFIPLTRLICVFATSIVIHIRVQMIGQASVQLDAIFRAAVVCLFRL